VFDLALTMGDRQFNEQRYTFPDAFDERKSSQRTLNIRRSQRLHYTTHRVSGSEE
jgi:hypothetical protein